MDGRGDGVDALGHEGIHRGPADRDVEVLGGGENNVRLNFDSHTSLAGLDKEEERIHLPSYSAWDIAMERSKAVKIKPGSKFVFEGRVVVGSPFDLGGLPGKAFYYKGSCFTVAVHNAHFID